MDVAQYTRDELQRLEKGYELWQEEKQRQRETGRTPSESQRQREKDALSSFQ